MSQGQSRHVPERNWPALRAEYETTPKLSLRQLALKHGISRSTMFLRSRSEHWRKPANIVRAAIRDALAEASDLAQARVTDDLAPYIEAKKREFTRRGVQFAETGLDRVTDYFKRKKRVTNTKDEAMISKAGSEYHRAGRLALGMNEGAVVVGAINFTAITMGGQFPSEPNEKSCGSELE